MRVARKFIISGRVQGVGFRYFAERAANQLRLTGYVRNNGDGTVEAYAVGEPGALEEFKRLLAKGPASAQVTNIFESDEPVEKQYGGFRIE